MCVKARMENSNTVHQLRGRQKVRQTEGEASIMAQCVNIEKGTLIQRKTDFCKSKTKHVYDVLHRLNTDWLISKSGLQTGCLCP